MISMSTYLDDPPTSSWFLQKLTLKTGDESNEHQNPTQRVVVWMGIGRWSQTADTGSDLRSHDLRRTRKLL